MSERTLIQRLRRAYRNFNKGTEDLRPLLVLAVKEIERLEEDRDGNKMAAEEASEIIGELAPALAKLCGEELTPCPSCEGHLKEGGIKAIRSARDAWIELVTERDSQRAEAERLLAWLQMIDGGDNPCTDEKQLRQWAYEALTLGRELQK